jgi:hypothetical protein
VSVTARVEGDNDNRLGAVATGLLNGGLWRSATTDSSWGRGIGGGSRGGPGAANLGRGDRSGDGLGWCGGGTWCEVRRRNAMKRAHRFAAADDDAKGVSLFL